VAAEDANFMEHEGFDWDAIQRAYAQNLKKGRVVAGGSTISQQLAKNLFLSGRRTALRKLQEALITVMIEAVMSKRRIFEIYLNIIEWGDGVFGAEAASRHYFRKSAANLDAWEAAYLAAMVPNPRYYDRNRTTAYLQDKTNLILGRMPGAEVP
jgi:monofunctional biosynthetic peptidoglycan transglycosylase